MRLYKKKVLGVTVGGILAISPLAFAQAKTDNSRVIIRDRSTNEITADQQSNDTKDIEITRQIRRKLMSDQNLSTYAKNIKVITRNGEVVFKGPVKSMREKTAIENHARSIAGIEKIENQLSVKK